MRTVRISHYFPFKGTAYVPNAVESFDDDDAEQIVNNGFGRYTDEDVTGAIPGVTTGWRDVSSACTGSEDGDGLVVIRRTGNDVEIAFDPALTLTDLTPLRDNNFVTTPGWSTPVIPTAAGDGWVATLSVDLTADDGSLSGRVIISGTTISFDDSSVSSRYGRGYAKWATDGLMPTVLPGVPAPF